MVPQRRGCSLGPGVWGCVQGCRGGGGGGRGLKTTLGVRMYDLGLGVVFIGACWLGFCSALGGLESCSDLGLGGVFSSAVGVVVGSESL